jgi:polar amino acid transport system ATP-binding protein
VSDALVLDGVRKSFGRLEVLRGIDLAVAEHEVVCLIGASGSGKSTLLRCVNLIEPIDAGRIFVEGDEITARGVNVNRIRRGSGSCTRRTTSSRTCRCCETSRSRPGRC